MTTEEKPEGTTTPEGEALELKIRKMGGNQALAKNMIRVACRDVPIEEKDPSRFLVVRTDDEDRGAIMEKDGSLGEFQWVQIFFKWGEWYDTQENLDLLAKRRRQAGQKRQP